MENRPFLQFGVVRFPPTAWVAFAEAHPDQAVAAPVETVAMNGPLRAHLSQINGIVNQGIECRPNDGTIMEPWRIIDASQAGDQRPRGDCHDYAVTKRALLLKAGWPASALLLAEVVAPEDKTIDHLVVVVRTTSGDVVLDNLTPGQTPLWSVRNFEWKAIQTPENPMMWKTVIV